MLPDLGGPRSLALAKKVADCADGRDWGESHIFPSYKSNCLGLKSGQRKRVDLVFYEYGDFFSVIFDADSGDFWNLVSAIEAAGLRPGLKTDERLKCKNAEDGAKRVVNSMMNDVYATGRWPDEWSNEEIDSILRGDNR